ncbi:hypothetical protein M758_1G146900 [Ceratodon purpureus]|uniref:Uncharacterized protein n=1 Tax=Ceratodon purpureus TaxID=3225 RepID=A0A8T0J8M4_CERPU|nr:hypothetical protein KC19_1G149500 [Ceratodon purpureus]KAG0630007.1 hypothetical protein M758_1G146900 [Ceratodon purpureus]
MAKIILCFLALVVAMLAGANALSCNTNGASPSYVTGVLKVYKISVAHVLVWNLCLFRRNQ